MKFIRQYIMIYYTDSIFKTSKMNQRIILLIFTFEIIGKLSTNKVYRIKEETETGYVIDYIKSNEQNQLKIFNTKDLGVNCFDLESNTGKLFTIRKIDREEICPTNRLVKFNHNRCEIIIKLNHLNTNFVQRLTIIVEDINDNAPVWNLEKVRISFKENLPINTRISLPEASDLDVGSNGQITYRMESKYRNSFRIVQDNGLYIENTQILDREKKSTYEITIIAQDSGASSRSSELEVLVEIIDVNDNPPKFSESIFRPDKLVPENSPPGTTILHLKAQDLDAGVNGDFSFRISPNSPSDVKTYFFVKSSGEIDIKSPIDYDNGQIHFEFKVIVQDHAVEPYSLSSEATVEIDIQDINDEYPKIDFYPLNADPATRYPTIPENSPAMTKIGHISVKDRDFKGLDKVTCETFYSHSDKNNPILVMATNELNEFNVVSNRKFDRENESLLHVEIRCCDASNHDSKINLTIMIMDVNDNAPEFSKNTYHFYMNENEPIGTSVDSRLFINDKDTGNNGKYEISIEPPGDNLFTVDQQTQTLKSRATFDRESVSVHKLKLFAIDRGVNKLTSSCTVFVHIKDVNDNPVLMSPSFYSFHVPENKKQSQLGVIKATDLDNQTIAYSIDSKSQIKFTIEKYSGKLFLQNSLDREELDTHIIKVTASDSIHTASTTVTVFVDDENDNKPFFINPTNSNKVIKLDATESPGYKICQIKATDNDSGNNGVVKYRLKKSSFNEQLFNLDSETGDLHLAVSLQTIRRIDTNIYLDIEACDQGSPSQCSLLSGLEIQPTMNKNESPNKDPSKHSRFVFENLLNENVLIAAISGLLVLMIIIMILFIVFKQKSALFARMPDRSNMSTQKKHINPSMTCYRETFITPEYHCSTELENLDADMRQNLEMGTTPIFHCSNLCITDSKEKSGTGPIFVETASRSMSPLVENQLNIKDFSRKPTGNSENYYCKYFTDHSSSITISESSNQISDFNNVPKIKNKKHQSSFV